MDSGGYRRGRRSSCRRCPGQAVPLSVPHQADHTPRRRQAGLLWQPRATRGSEHPPAAPLSGPPSTLGGYAKPPFAGPEAVLAYLSRYTHRVAISNRRLLAFDETGITFRYKDYRRDGADRQRVMTLGTDEFIRRFLLHLLPRGFHRIRHYGLLSAAACKVSLARPANYSPSRRRAMTTCRKSRSMSAHRHSHLILRQ